MGALLLAFSAGYVWLDGMAGRYERDGFHGTDARTASTWFLVAGIAVACTLAFDVITSMRLRSVEKRRGFSCERKSGM
jgi:hypothetical protein